MLRSERFHSLKLSLVYEDNFHPQKAADLTGEWMRARAGPEEEHISQMAPTQTQNVRTPGSLS